MPHGDPLGHLVDEALGGLDGGGESQFSIQFIPGRGTVLFNSVTGETVTLARDPNVGESELDRAERERQTNISAGLSAERNELERARLDEQITQNVLDNSADERNHQFLVDKLRSEEERDDRTAARQTSQLIETIQSRIASNNIVRQQLTLQVQQFNARAEAEADQLNEQRRQSNIEQQQSIAETVGRLSREPGDIGEISAFLTAGGADPVSTFIGEGKTAITEESTRALQIALGALSESQQGPQFFEPSLVMEPQFQQQGVPDFEALFTQLMGGGGGATAQPAPSSPAQPTDNRSAFFEQLSGLVTGGAPNIAIEQARQNILTEFGQTGLTEFDELPVIEAAEGFFGEITEPTLILAGENGPESVNIQPQNAQTFLGNALELAFQRAGQERVQAPVEVSAPGTFRFQQELQAGIAGLGRGIPRDVFFEAISRARPVAIQNRPIRRTA